MTKFQDMRYERPDFDAAYREMEGVLQTLKDAKDADSFIEALIALDKKGQQISSMGTLCHIRHTIDTRDSFYDKEHEVFNQESPRFNIIGTQAMQTVLESPFREAVAERFGPHLLEKYAVGLKAFKPEIVDDLAEENKLKSEYQKLMASAQIEFEGKTLNLSGLTPYMESPDRGMRERATQAAWGWVLEQQDQLDEIYDKLVKLRHQIGLKMGYDSFIPVAYARMGRTDWDQEDARRYRQQILDSVVPLAQKMYREQGERIGIPDMRVYDLPLMFLSGNPTPKGEEAYMVEQAAQMYRELSPETDAFFTTMVAQELMDLTTKPGKAPGGYMTFIEEHGVPFIFSNFNGTSGDVDVLTHEAGHAFQGWLTRDVVPSDLRDYTSEVAEIHSMSMEFFTHPWMERFFKEDTEKYYYAHVVDAIKFLPYGASIDAFQEWVYEHPEATPAERRAQYREIERQYLPHLNYEGFPGLEGGGRWQRQLHLYLYPFYYLDYTLSQVVALQYFAWDMKDHKAAWQSYLTLCQESGKIPFKQLVPASGLESPFEDGTIAKLTPQLETYLDGLDRSRIH